MVTSAVFRWCIGNEYKIKYYIIYKYKKNKLLFDPKADVSQTHILGDFTKILELFKRLQEGVQCACYSLQYYACHSLHLK